jgi:hypothetical protein
MWQTIRDLVAQGTTVLLTTQHLDEADQLADEVVVLAGGVIVAAGAPAELAAAAGQPRIRVSLPAAWPQELRDVQAALGPGAQAHGRTVTVPAPDGLTSLAAAVQRLAASGIRSSVLVGRTVSTVIVGLPSLAVMIGCGLAVGWRPHGGLGSTIGAFALLSLFGFAMGWVGAAIGLLARSPQSADALSMVPAFLLGFISNVFVDPPACRLGSGWPRTGIPCPPWWPRPANSSAPPKAPRPPVSGHCSIRS